MSAPEDAIRARRRLTNRLIAARDASRLKPFFAPDMKLIVGDGGLILGADDVVRAFAVQFAPPTSAVYERLTQSVQVDDASVRAVEQGVWTGAWTENSVRVLQTGVYTAVWRAVRGQWLIEAELYTGLTSPSASV